MNHSSLCTWSSKKLNSCFYVLKGRLHGLIKCPFSAPILGPYLVNRSVLALITGPFQVQVNAPLGTLIKICYDNDPLVSGEHRWLCWICDKPILCLEQIWSRANRLLGTGEVGPRPNTMGFVSIILQLKIMHFSVTKKT